MQCEKMFAYFSRCDAHSNTATKPHMPYLKRYNGGMRTSLMRIIWGNETADSNGGQVRALKMRQLECVSRCAREAKSRLSSDFQCWKVAKAHSFCLIVMRAQCASRRAGIPKIRNNAQLPYAWRRCANAHAISMRRRALTR